MTKQIINVGTAANDKKGDSLRAAFQKVNANFTELYTELGLVNDVTLSLGAFEFTGSTMTTTDSTAIVIDQATTVTSNLSVGGDILPQTANGGDLGSSTLPWRSLYVSNNTIYIGGTAVGVDANGNLTTGGTVVGSTPAWANITGKPTIPTSFDRLVNGANTVSLGSTGILTFPNGLLKIAGNKIRNVNESVGLIAGSEIEVTVDKTVISNGLTDTEGPSNQHIFEVGSTRIFSAYQVINTLGDGEGGPSLTGQQLTELTSTGFQIGQRVINDPGGEGEPLTSFSGWTFGTVGQSQAITFPDSTVQSTAWNGTVSQLRSEGNIDIDINLTDSTLRRWSFGEDGNLTLPAGGTILNSSGQPYVNGVSSINTSVTTSIFTDASGDYTYGTLSYDYAVNGVSNSFSIEYSRPLVGGNVDINVGNTIVNGDLTLSGDIKSNGNINIDINLSDSTLRRWQFGEDGNLTLPTGGDIKDSTGTSVLGGGGSVSSLVNGAYTVSLGSTGTLTVPADGIITAPINQEFQLQAKDANSVLRNEINLDPTNGTYMSVWRDGTTSFSTGAGSWATASWNNEGGLGAARFTDAQALQDFWLTGIGNIEGVAIEASINGGARTPNVFYDDNNGETYGVFLGLDAVPPGGQGTTVPITSLVFYYRLQSKINMDVTGGGEILVDAQAMDIDLRTTKILDLRANENLNLRGLGQYPVKIYTNNNTRIWEFDNTGSLTLPSEGKIYGIGAPNDRYGYISWDGNSSGDGSGYNTMRLVPDLQGLEAADQYIILDPTGGVPGHIHIRAGGTQDNSGAHLYLGGEHSHVKISAGLNPPVTVMADDNAWIFGTDGDLTVPGDIKSTANTSIIIDGGVLFANVTVQTVDSFGGGVWRMFISSSAYPTVGTIVQVGDTATTAWGTPVTVTITSIVQDIGAGTWALHTNQDITTGFFFGPGTQTITINSTQVKTWTFSTDKSLTFPDGTKQTTAAQAFSFSVAADDSTQRAISNNELIKFIGAGGITTSSDAEGNITINGSGGGAVTAERFNTDQITVVGNRISTTVTNANLELECNGTGGVVINTVAEATTASTARSVGYLGIPASTVTTTATLTIADAGEHIYLTTTSNTITIPANASVAYPIGTTLTFIAGPSATITTIAITSDTLRLAGSSSTGTRTLAANGMATAVKVASTLWYINGIGLT